MTSDQLNAVQRRYKEEFGIKRVEFAEDFLLTDYNTFYRWGKGSVPVPGPVEVAAKLLIYLADIGLSADRIRAMVSAPLK